MPHLTRKAFPDRLLSRDELSCLADLWRCWYEHATLGRQAGRTPYQRWQVRVWGIPHGRAEALRATLAARAEAWKLLVESVERDDADVLIVQSRPTTLGEPWPDGLGLDLLHGPDFEGLPV